MTDPTPDDLAVAKCAPCADGQPCPYHTDNGLPDGLYEDIESAVHIHMSLDGQSDEANDWVTDLMSAITPHVAAALRATRAKAEDLDEQNQLLTDDVVRLMGERDQAGNLAQAMAAAIGWETDGDDWIEKAAASAERLQEVSSSVPGRPEPDPTPEQVQGEAPCWAHKGEPHWHADDKQMLWHQGDGWSIADITVHATQGDPDEAAAYFALVDCVRRADGPAPGRMCHNGHPFVPGKDEDYLDAPGADDWCNVCGEADGPVPGHTNQTDEPCTTCGGRRYVHLWPCPDCVSVGDPEDNQ